MSALTEGAEALLRELVEVQQEADGFVEAEVTGFEDESDAAWSQSEAEVRREALGALDAETLRARRAAGAEVSRATLERFARAHAGGEASACVEAARARLPSGS